ncbi:replicative DNA helicase [Kyrpidia spormannii]|uniref:Replicative DNA helicase n=3 Tax=Kyrpidia spormannii TaxID=2055160 RepID=A0A2K8NCV2_9BACL|nr:MULTISPECIES: replicative DNA helicase [Kyrpidia]ATY86300.1 replicative DNA helicase [Kyrpidia spormannii]MCL6576868.1 replicative DNA helicase [Kyrpidia sp.]CAB3395833.1 replicative DNA helicase [Kyrpidia spormannii]CAB3396342.1 replicative DNA helicase [Kyrpidia spormannii]
MSDSMQDRVPPQSVEAEQAVLGAALLDGAAFHLALERLTPEDFYRSAHQKIFRAMAEVSSHGDPVDLVTVTARLQDAGQLDECGGASYLAELAHIVPATGNVEHYIDLVHDKSVLRQLIRTATQIAAKGYEPAEDVAGLLDEAEQRIFEITQSRVVRGFIPIRDILEQAFERIEYLYANKGQVTGVPSGFPDLDRLTSGFQKSDLIIVAARPSVGKTAFALNIAQNVGVRYGLPVAILSLEMSKEQLVQRMLSAEANLDAHKLRTGFLDEQDWPKLTMAVANLSEAPIYVDDTPGITIAEMRSKCRRLKAERGLGLIVVDYLQLMQGRGRADNRQQEISEISRGLKALARELEVPVIALSQLSRSVEQRQDKRPLLSDIRESGSIEQDADLVAFLYREDYYDPDTDRKNVIEVIIAKQRNGPTGKVEMVFLKNFNKFVNLERVSAGEGTP